MLIAFLMLGFSKLSWKAQMGLVQAGWSEVLILALVFRSLPSTTVSRPSKEVKLKFAPDYSLNESMATQNGLKDFYEQVS